MKNSSLLLIGHGSRDPEAQAGFERITLMIKERFAFKDVLGCFLELSSPSIPEGFKSLINKGAQEIIAFPYFLFPARHLKKEIPQQLKELSLLFPEIKITYIEQALGISEKVLEVARQRVMEAKEKLFQYFGFLHPVSILIVGRGGSDSSIFMTEVARKLGQILNEEIKYCFIDLTPPLLEQGLKSYLYASAKAIIILPYFLFSGLLVKRMKIKVMEFQKGFASVPVVCGEPLGVHPLMVEAVLEKAQRYDLGS